MPYTSDNWDFTFSSPFNYSGMFNGSITTNDYDPASAMSSMRGLFR